jgi:hypothetical protein
MTRPEGETQILIGKLILEQSTLEKQIGKLRDEISQRARTFAYVGKLLVFQPERLVFKGQTVPEQFAGEAAVDRSAMDVDSLVADLRAAIVRKSECTAELAAIGIDLEEAEREQNFRASRALFHPANVSYGPEDRRTKEGNIGFTKPRKKPG